MIRKMLEKIGIQEIYMVECPECRSLLHPYFQPKNPCEQCKELWI